MNKASRIILFVAILGLVLFFAYKKIDQNTHSSAKIILNLGHSMSIDSIQHKGAQYFKNLVEAKTMGRININIHPNERYGTTAELIDDIKQNLLNFAISLTTELTPLSQRLELLDIPFLFKDKESYHKALEGDFGTYIFAELKTLGIIPITFWEGGMNSFSCNKPIYRPIDFEGMRINGANSSILQDQSICLNSFPIDAAISNAKRNQEKSSAECQENSLIDAAKLRFPEIQKHLLLSQHRTNTHLLISNQQTLDRLSLQNKETILVAAQETASFIKGEIDKIEESTKRDLIKLGVEITDLTAKDEFIQSFAPIYYSKRKMLSQFKDFIDPNITKHLIESIGIGLNLSFSYQSYSSALSIKRGAQLAIEEINSKGGIAGKKLILLTKTHDGFPQKGKRNLKELHKDKSVISIIGGMHSPVILAERPLVNELKVPYLIPWAAATPIINPENPFIFRYSVRDADAGKKLVERSSLHGSKTYLILEDTGWGKSNRKSIANAMADNNKISIAGTEWFEWGRTDFSKAIREINRSNADSIIYVGNSPEALHLTKGLVQNNVKVPIVSHWGITGGRFWNNMRGTIQNVNLSILTTKAVLGDDINKSLESFLRVYKERFKIKNNAQIPSFFGTVHSYELIKILANAIRKTNSFDRIEIRNTLRQLSDYKGVYKHHAAIFTREGREQEALDESDLTFSVYDSSGTLYEQ